MKLYSLVLGLFLLALLSGCGKGCSSQQSQEAIIPSSDPLAQQEETLTPLPPDKFPTPTQAIQDLDKKVESYKTGPGLTSEDVQDNLKLKAKIIRGTFDLYELCRLALDKHWEPLSEKDRHYFSDLMTRLLERKAIFSKEQVKDQSKPYKIQYKSESYLDAEKTMAKVSSILFVPSEKIDLNIHYLLKKTPYGWKIYDVIVDDASLVENYKFQFNTIITKNGYPNLIERMENKLKEMQ